MSIFVKLFLCLEFYSKILIDRSGYFVYNSNRPTGRLLDLGFGLIDWFVDWLDNTNVLEKWTKGNKIQLLWDNVFHDKCKKGGGSNLGSISQSGQEFQLDAILLVHILDAEKQQWWAIHYCAWCILWLKTVKGIRINSENPFSLAINYFVEISVSQSFDFCLFISCLHNIKALKYIYLIWQYGRFSICPSESWYAYPHPCTNQTRIQCCTINPDDSPHDPALPSPWRHQFPGSPGSSRSRWRAWCQIRPSSWTRRSHCWQSSSRSPSVCIPPSLKTGQHEGMTTLSNGK